VYTVAVLAKNGSVTAGQQFDSPIQFKMIPSFATMFSGVEQGLIDFVWVNPGQFSCIESEFEAYSLVSQVSRRVVGGEVYNLKKFGGVIMTRADNDDVETIYDLKGKVVAAASITGLGSGQMQFLEMKNAGMEYLNNWKQLVFTRNQGKIVNGVLNGDFDVGFVRTDQMECTKDADGNPIGLSLFKVIDPKPGLNIDRVPFPFESSTVRLFCACLASLARP
jgi:ABC-type phosphate/phosphonate transport system substrate-binding protein